MPFQSVPNTASIAIQWSINSALCVNVLHAERSGGYNETQLQDLADLVDAFMDTDWLPTATSQHVYDQVTVRGLENENDFEVVSNTNAGAGGETAAIFPNNVTKAIKLTSGLTGRSARGRSYFPTMNTAYLTSNENFLTSPAADLMVDILTDLLADITAGGWVPVIVSRVLEGVLRDPAVTFPIILASVDDFSTDSMRSRLP